MKTVIPTLVSNNSNGMYGNGANYVTRNKSDPETSASYFSCSTSSSPSSANLSNRNDQTGGEVRIRVFAF